MSDHSVFDYNKFMENREHIVISSEEALEDVVPFKWSKDVLEVRKKVVIDKKIE